MLEFPMRPLSARDLAPAGGLQVLDEFSNFARHLETEQTHPRSGNLAAALVKASFPTAT
jgi:hypothetical protein